MKCTCIISKFSQGHFGLAAITWERERQLFLQVVCLFNWPAACSSAQLSLHNTHATSLVLFWLRDSKQQGIHIVSLMWKRYISYLGVSVSDTDFTQRNLILPARSVCQDISETCRKRSTSLTYAEDMMYYSLWSSQWVFTQGSGWHRISHRGVIWLALPITDVPLNRAANTSGSLNSKFWHGTITTSMPLSHTDQSYRILSAQDTQYLLTHSFAFPSLLVECQLAQVHKEDMQMGRK